MHPIGKSRMSHDGRYDFGPDCKMGRSLIIIIAILCCDYSPASISNNATCNAPSRS